MVIIEALHNYRYVITKPINVRQSIMNIWFVVIYSLPFNEQQQTGPA
jgi:hypothetical protein